MEVVAFYIFAAICGVGIARGIRSSLSQLPFGMAYSDRIIRSLIWILALSYLYLTPFLLSAAIEKNLKSWMFAAIVPWAVCVLGLPMVLPRLWAAMLTRLRDGASQWLFTVVAAIMGYWVFIAAQWHADSVIQSIMQTHPDQLPGAQRALTAIGAAYGWIAMLYVIAVLTTFVTTSVKLQSSGRPVLGMTEALSVLFALLIIPPNAFDTFQKVTPFDKHGSRLIRGSLAENLIIWTSFMPNRVVDGVLRSEAEGFIQQTRLACRNLAPEAYVAFIHPDEMMPDKVVVAEPKGGEIAEGAPVYSYRLSACENSNNPDGIK